MKAGTAQKMILNMVSSGAMTRLGYVYRNLMLNVHLKNEKLVQRGVNILEQAAGGSSEHARAALNPAGKHLPIALVMLAAHVNRRAAERDLKQGNGQVG